MGSFTPYGSAPEGDAANEMQRGRDVPCSNFGGSGPGLERAGPMLRSSACSRRNPQATVGQPWNDVKAALLRREFNLSLEAARRHHAAHPAPCEAIHDIAAVVQHLRRQRRVAEFMRAGAPAEQRGEGARAIEILQVEVVRRARADDQDGLGGKVALGVVVYRFAT